MNLKEFQNNITTYFLEKNINYNLNNVSMISSDKNIYVATFNYDEGDWPEPSMLNFLQLRKKCQSINIPNRIYVNAYILTCVEDEEEFKKLQIHFK